MSAELARELLDEAHEVRLEQQSLERETFGGLKADERTAAALTVLALTALANTEALLALVAKVESAEVTP